MSGEAEPAGGASAANGAAVLAHVEGLIARHIAAYSAKRSFYRRRSFVQTISASVFGALTTFSIGLGQIYPSSWLTAVSLGCAGITTVTAAWAGWLGARQSWVIHQSSLNKLHTLRERIELDKVSRPGGTVPWETVTEYHGRLQEILDENNAHWEQLRLTQS